MAISCKCPRNIPDAAEMGISLFLDIDRYTLEDAKVELSYHLRLVDGSYESVPWEFLR